MSDDLHPMLRPNASDRAEKALKALTSSIDIVAPGCGSFLGELISAVIPNTTSQRIAEYLTRVGRRLAALEVRVEGLEKKLGPEQVALFEDGARSAARSTSSQRIERLAAVVAYGMATDDGEAERNRTVLQILDQLSEADLLRLDSFIWRMGPDPRRPSGPQHPWANYGEGFESLPPAEQTRIAMAARSQAEEVKALEDHRIAKLLALNLLQQPTGLVPGRPLLGGGKGMPIIKKEEPRLTHLGAMVLAKTGLGQDTWEGVLERDREAAESAAR